MTGYDTSFPVACAEDIELSYRMSARGWKMKFVPAAIVYHTHPDTLWRYLKKKYKFAFWRVLAVRKNPSKAVKDSHTPQLMKLQLLFAARSAGCSGLRPGGAASGACVSRGACRLSAQHAAVRTAGITKDPIVGLLSFQLLAARACAQMLGVTAGLIHACREPGQSRFTA